ncbi:DUF2922 domain-containing protein [Macrococcoides bohemicum]|uniref:DUF2922 domain-containing protein n=1 Tax=Macrococcoides bohemicum TaxID=1903056 RepID=A0AAJ4P8Y3_9STAP|nr:DUF2922 domain-containing protein [Macrococcus bohemicus]QYA41287.1 DUF2922 domain-containing protein [Macrococcus bohemicus]QYA43718.1 DUF2922 domain-containing protein [Macrococcus bohemicus]
MKSLQMNFLTDTGKNYTFTVNQPKQDLTRETVLSVMESIVNSKYFITTVGVPVSVKSAKLVDKVETILFDSEEK